MPRKLVDPPSSSTGALGTWLRKLHQHLETQPNISLVSFGPTATPNSTVTGLSGDLCVNIGSGSTDGRLWIMGGAARSALTRQGWVATLPGGSSAPPAGAAGGVLSGTYPNPGFAASPTFTGTLTAAIATFSGLVTASAGATIASGQTLTVTGATITGAPTWTNTQTLNTTSTTALATPSAYTVTTGAFFASAASGATLMGFGTTGDVTLKNRAGTDVIIVSPATPNVTMAGALAITGALTGITTLAASGLITASFGINIAGGSFAPGSLYYNSTNGLSIGAITGSGTDFRIVNAAGSAAALQLTPGTNNWVFGSSALSGITTIAASSTITFTGVTDATSSTTGILQVSGGVGIAKKLYVGTNGVFGAPVRLPAYLVANLPAGVQGDFAVATDLATPALFVAAVGGGTVVGTVLYNGTAWVAA